MYKRNTTALRGSLHHECFRLDFVYRAGSVTIPKCERERAVRGGYVSTVWIRRIRKRGHATVTISEAKAALLYGARSGTQIMGYSGKTRQE